MKITEQNIDKIARLIRSRVIDTLVATFEPTSNPGSPEPTQINVQFMPEKVFVAVYANEECLCRSEIELKK